MKHNKLLLYTGVLTALLVALSAAYGLFGNSYAAETKNWQVQGIAQDMVDIYIITPALLLSLIRTYRGSRFFAFMLGGILIFLAYSYAIYCFSVHFNNAFLLYCAVFGLSIYLFIYLLVIFPVGRAASFSNSNIPVRSTAVFMAIIALLFYGLWLSDIIPAIIHNKLPAVLAETGLLTNPVHVLDISLLLPALLICSFLLYKKHAVAFFMAPVLLVFCTLMEINIILLTIMMAQKGLANGYTTVIPMGILAVLSTFFLYRFCKHLVAKPVTADNYHAGH